MANTLQEILLSRDIEPQLITDCCALIEREVAELSGISGTAVKLGYKTARTFKPGYIPDTVQYLLPGLVEELAPYWADFRASGSSEFGDYLAKRGEEVSEALLSVADARATASDSLLVVKAYNSVRASAAKHVEAALPRVAEVVCKYAT